LDRKIRKSAMSPGATGPWTKITSSLTLAMHFASAAKSRILICSNTCGVLSFFRLIPSKYPQKYGFKDKSLTSQEIIYA
jgi:hypothetical protein